MASPHTPLRSISNSSKKRIPTSALSRTSATPSHVSKMSAIFHDAAIPLHNIPTPSRPWSSNTKRTRTRIPLSDARNIHFGTFYSESVRNQVAARDDTPPTPTPIPGEMTEEITYPTLPDLPPTSIPLSNNPSIKPPNTTTSEPHKVSPSPSPQHKHNHPTSSRHTSQSSSNKENLNPQRLPRTPTTSETSETSDPCTPSPTFHLPATPYLRHRSNAPSPSPRRRTPPGRLCSPPKRRRVHVVPVREVGSGSEGHGDGDGEGGDGEGGQGDGGEEEVELVQLSPGVECYRKGRGPRRGRCGSYWDRDVIRVGRGDTASEETPEDIETENLIAKNKDGDDRAVLVVIESDAKDVPPYGHDMSDADIENRRFEFMVGRKAKRRS